MRSLLPLALALTLTTPAQAQYKTDRTSTWDLTVATFGAYQCSATEGLLTLDEAVKAAFDFLAERRNLERYQVGNIIQRKEFWPAVKAFQARHGGCPSIAEGIKQHGRKLERNNSNPAVIY